MPVTANNKEIEADFDLPEFGRRGETGSQVQKGTYRRIVTEKYYFELLFDDEILTTFVEQTNSYAANNKSKSWTRDTDKVEFKLFLAVILFMGISRLPETEMYWSDNFFSGTWVRELMTKTRFRELIRCWHWLDTS